MTKQDGQPQAASAKEKLRLSPERRAALEPRLAALLADFAKLEALITPETEPAMTPDLEGYAGE